MKRCKRHSEVTTPRSYEVVIPLGPRSYEDARFIASEIQERTGRMAFAVLAPAPRAPGVAKGGKRGRNNKGGTRRG